MASSDSIGKGMFALVAVAVIAVSAVVGYFAAGGIQQPKQADSVQTVQTPQAQTPVVPDSSKVAAPAATHRPDYTAQDAPDITIREEKAPASPPTDQTDQTSQATANGTPPPDSEASQEASPSPPTDSTDPSNTVGAAPAQATPDANAATPAAPKQDSGQDSQQTNNGSSTGSTPAISQSPLPSGIVRYRVQIGSFEQAISARSLADALRTRGYSTDTVTERDGDKTVYHVQAGAFRTRTDADAATVELQRQGFPAFVSTISQ